MTKSLSDAGLPLFALAGVSVSSKKLEYSFLLSTLRFESATRIESAKRGFCSSLINAGLLVFALTVVSVSSKTLRLESATRIFVYLL